MIFLLLLFCGTITAQDLDRRSWLDAGDGRQRVEALEDILKRDRSITLEQVLGHDSSDECSLLAAEVNEAFARAAYFRSEHAAAMEYLLMARKCYRQMNDVSAEGHLVLWEGRILMSSNRSANALERMLRARSIAETDLDSALLAQSTLFLAIMYEGVDPDTSRALLEQAWKIGIRHRPMTAFSALRRLSEDTDFSHIEREGFLAHASDMLEKGMIDDENNWLDYSVATLALDKGDLDKAQRLYEQHLHSMQASGHVAWMSYDHSLLAKIAIMRGDDSKAEQYARAGLLIAEKHELIKEVQDNLSILTRILEKKGKYKEALDLSRRFHQIKDSVRAELYRSGLDNAVAITVMEQRLQLDSLKADRILKEEKLLAAARLQREEIRRNWLLAIALVIFFAGVIVYRQRGKIKIAHRQSEALLRNILPAEVAQELKVTGKAAPRAFGHVTVVFTDFKGFTMVAGALSAEEIVTLIDHYFRSFDEIVMKHGLEKIKTIGDAYMCVSGLPDESPDHALRAVRAAQEILRFVKNEEARRTLSGEPWFAIRIGLHSGPVVAGVVGETKFAYDIWGDTVNTAARLEQHGEAGRINISRSTFEYVKHRFPCTPKGFITVKHGVELELYQVEEIGELVV